MFIDRCRIDVPILFYIPIGFQFEFLWVIRNFFGLSFFGVVSGVVFPVSVTVDDVLGPDFELVTPRSVGITEEIPEQQDTIAGNASQKARYVHDRTGCDCFADDTGLEVEALGGAPGVHSARYATDGHDFAANNELLLRNLEGVGNRRARFRTVISLILDGEEHLFEGIVEGHIAQCASGSEGFGYDPLFIPEGSAKTYGEMDPAEKNALSHRGRAVRKLAEFLHNRGK